jgi:hypothetical protein
MEQLENIDNIIETGLIHVYRNGKLILTGKNIKDIKKLIKESFNNPSKDIKVYLIELGIRPETKNPLLIECSQMTITPDLKLILGEGDRMQTILYSKKDLEKTPFKLSHIQTIIKSIKNKTISLRLSENVFISDILKQNKMKRTKKSSKKNKK